jgi:exodeoxyribonuclease VIII
MWRQDLPNESYHNDFRSYLSSSDLRRLLRSPAHYRNPQKLESPALAFGTLVHTFVLEPHVAEARYRPRADVDGRTKEGKTVRDWESALAAQQGVQFVNRSDYDAATSITASVCSHLGCSSLLSGGLAEVSGTVEGFRDINARIRPDYLTDKHIVDLKTCVDARSDAFSRSVINFLYQVQAAFYVDVAEAIDGKKRDFYWIGVEKDAPYAVSVFKASDAMLEHGRQQYRKAIELYKECAAMDLFPAYSQQVQTLELPNWVKE